MILTNTTVASTKWLNVATTITTITTTPTTVTNNAKPTIFFIFSLHADSNGIGRTGVFLTLSIVLERMRYEGVVDMFQTVRMLRTQRPSLVETEDQYQFCYSATLEYLSSFDHYAT